MVTHDPALKNLADRVVYMRDGRVHRIDTVDESVRLEAKIKLREQLQSAIGLGSLQKGKFSNATEFRAPKDYDTYSREAENG